MHRFNSGLTCLQLAGLSFALSAAGISSAKSATAFTATDLANEEAKFAAHSLKTGMNTAFRAFFAARSTLLRPDPVDAQSWLAGRPDPPIRLDWRPQLTVLAASGDLGLSTGPWERSALSAGPTGQPAAKSYGQFFSIWQREQDGQWKVLFDHGISHETNALWTQPLNAITLAPAPTGSGIAVTSGDASPEESFIAQLRSRPWRDAYAAVLRPSTRLLLEGKIPVDGRDVLGRVNPEGDPSAAVKMSDWTWSPLQQGISSSQDFVYVLGRYTAASTAKSGTEKPARGYYFRVWIRDLSGAAPRWTLAAEMRTPTP